MFTLNVLINYNSNKIIQTKSPDQIKILVRTQYIETKKPSPKVLPKATPKKNKPIPRNTVKRKAFATKPIAQKPIEHKPVATTNTPDTKEPTTTNNNLLRSQDGKVASQKYVNRLKVFLEQNKSYPKIAKKLKEEN